MKKYLLFLLLFCAAACTTHHSFSINAEEMVNPSINYADSSRVSLPNRP